MLDDLKARWEVLEQSGFPVDCHNEQLQEYQLTLLYSDMATYILTFLQTQGMLGRRQTLELQKCVQKVEQVKDKLPSDSSKEFFQELKSIAEQILKTVGE